MSTQDDRSTYSSGYSDDTVSTGGRRAGIQQFDDSGYSSDDTAALAEPNEFDLEPERKPFGWNAGADLGLVILRLALGGTFILHGAQKLFGSFDGPGIQGFAQGLQKLGYRETEILSWVTGVTEFAGGILVVLGLFTPLAAAGLLGVMINSITIKWGNGFFTGTGDGFELDALLAAMAACLTLAGPGRVALDKGRSWWRYPLAVGLVCLLIAAGASAVTLYVLR